MNLPTALPERLCPLVDEHRERRQEPVRFRPEIWRARLEPHGVAGVLEIGRAGSTTGERLISREDLARLRDEVGADPDGLRGLFAAVMIWGSGTTNGRGPRYTKAALEDRQLLSALVGTRAKVCAGDLEGAYRGFRVNGVGRSFFTKWFAVVDDGSAAERALILDDRVFRTLNALGWVSWRAAGTRNRAARYVAYVRDMHSWAKELDVAPAWLEWLMFDLSGNVPSQEGPRTAAAEDK
ncbi:hypothetical protein [Streptomyces arenae]|uniref:8-oxoguanine DNA glycosylase OGG fold protein n=1 Tax=Streptomyces arenae TaxID=29301 RepID=UPI00265A46E9|nr:hypothetical protein [Streptomyces arenae]MCG7210746.1 hypothetical protein [Streptomyces arenae]